MAQKSKIKILHPVPRRNTEIIICSHQTKHTASVSDWYCYYLCCVTVLVPRFQKGKLPANNNTNNTIDWTASSSIENLYVQCCASSASRRAPPPSHHNWQEVGGRVLPAGFLPSDRLPVDVQAHKHLPLLVPPLGRGVRVVAVLLDALLQRAVNTKLPLERRGGIGLQRFTAPDM